jgi:hypothetical protein
MALDTISSWMGSGSTATLIVQLEPVFASFGEAFRIKAPSGLQDSSIVFERSK